VPIYPARHHPLQSSNFLVGGGERVNCEGRGESDWAFGTPLDAFLLALLVPLAFAFVFPGIFGVSGGCWLVRINPSKQTCFGHSCSREDVPPRVVRRIIVFLDVLVFYELQSVLRRVWLQFIWIKRG
jgi:hypothetical protein